jgi:oligoendopeptidase F
MPEGYRWGWSYIPHFIHSRFYCYSYVFGQLLVLALYRMYKDEGQTSSPNTSRSKAGGSDTPDALLKPLGVDIHQPEFWQKGFEEIRGLTTKLQAII